MNARFWTGDLVKDSARLALAANRTAVWARGMARRYTSERSFYIKMAARCRRDAANHLAQARRFKKARAA